MSPGLVQVILDCPDCRVEGAMVELVDGVVTGGVASRGTRLGRCRLCARTTIDGAEASPGRRFASGSDVEAALSAWAVAEGEPDLAVFLAANFGARTLPGVVDDVLARRRSETSFDVVAWLFRDRTGGRSVLGAADDPGGEASTGDDATGTLAGRSLAGGAPDDEARDDNGVAGGRWRDNRVASPATDARAATVALVTVALSDGLVPPLEAAAVARECSALGAPAPDAGDWRLWRPGEVGIPADPAATVAAMRRVALVTRLPDPSAARVIREFARHWRVAIPDVVLPPVTPVQRLSDAWMRFFGR